MENENGDNSVKVTERHKEKLAMNIKEEELNAEVKTHNKIETAIGENCLGINETDNTGSKKRNRRKEKNKNPESGDVLSTHENTQYKIETSTGEKGLGINETDNTGSKKRNRRKEKNKNPESVDVLSSRENTQYKIATVDQNNRVSSSSPTGDEKSSVSEIEAYSGKTGSSMTASINVEVKTENKMETAVGETGSVTKVTDNTASKKRKRPREEKKNPESGDVPSTRETTQYITSTADQNNRVPSLTAAGDEKSLVSKVEAYSGKTGSSMTASINAEVKTQNKMETVVGETGSVTNVTDNTASKKLKRLRKEKKNPESGDIPSTRESTQYTTATVDQNNRVTSSSPNGDVTSSITKVEASGTEMGSSMVASLNAENKMETVVGEIGSGTNAIDTGSKKRKRRKEKNNYPESSNILSTCLNTHDKTTTADQNNRVPSLTAAGDEKSSVSKIEAYSGKIGSSMTTSINAEVKTQDKMETAAGEMGTGTNVTDNTASKKSKRPKKKNPESGDILSTRENSQYETAAVDQNNRVSSSSNTGDVTSSVSKIEASSAVMGSGMLTDVNVEVKTQNKMETAVGETGSGTNATDNTGSKKRNRRKEKNNNPESGDVLSSCLNTHDKTATVDQNNRVLSSSVSGDEKSSVFKVEAYSGKTGSSMIESPNAEVKTEMETAVGEMDSGTNVTDNTASKKSKRPKKKKENSESLDLLCTHENMQFTTATVDQNNRVSSSSPTFDEKNSVSNFEISSGKTAAIMITGTELERGDHPKTANGVNDPSTTVDAENTMFSEVANNAEPAEAKVITTLPIKMAKQITEVQEKKLIILDVNGLLADNVSPPPKDIMVDYCIPKRAISFKRPFLDDFLSFCFERFHVGIWSSKMKHTLFPLVNFLLGNFRKKLLFLWDASKCTKSRMKTLEGKKKPIVFKDLRKIWENDGPPKPWEKGRFNESNTLLLDDSPYKALLNPKHSGIFPVSYSYKNRDDNFLAPKGELQNFLEGLAASANVTTYVEQHPFGQGFIDETHPDWTFYEGVLKNNASLNKFNQRTTYN